MRIMVQTSGDSLHRHAHTQGFGEAPQPPRAHKASFTRLTSWAYAPDCIDAGLPYSVIPDSVFFMPTGTPYNSFILPYPIRVDEFTSVSNLKTVPALHLLTHTHSDHVKGLSAKSFASTVICSPDAKEMLLKHEIYTERAMHAQEMRAQHVRTYEHLKVDRIKRKDGTLLHAGSRDLLVCISSLSLLYICQPCLESYSSEHAHEV
jgi:hypothetical protein